MSAALSGKVAVLTGGAGTLGRGIAQAYLDQGARIVIADLPGEGAQEVARTLEPTGERALAATADVTDADSLDELVDLAVRRFGGLDVMINNAGIVSRSARLHNVEIDDLRRVFDVNVVGVVHGMQAALRHFRPRGAGAIINTASVSGLAGWSHTGPYCASKAAVVNLTRVGALEYGREGIRVNAVCPGAFESPISTDVPPGARERILSHQPSGRLGKVHEVASAFVYLASDGASWVNGESLVVDGGFLAR